MIFWWDKIKKGYPIGWKMPKHEQPCHLYILNFPPFFGEGCAVGETWGYFTNLCNTAEDDLLQMASVSWSGFSGKTWEWRDNQTFKQETCQKIVHKCWIFHCHGSCQRVNHCIHVYIYINACIQFIHMHLISSMLPTTQRMKFWLPFSSTSGGQRTFGLATFFGATLLLPFWRLESTGATRGAKMEMMEMGERLVYTPWRF